MNLFDMLRERLKYEREGWTNAMHQVPVRDLDERVSATDTVINDLAKGEYPRSIQEAARQLRSLADAIDAGGHGNVDAHDAENIRKVTDTILNVKHCSCAAKDQKKAGPHHMLGCALYEHGARAVALR